MDVLVLLLIIGGSVVACFLKGKPIPAAFGLAAIVPLFFDLAALALIVAVPAIVGAITWAKEGSFWATNRRSESQPRAGQERFPDVPAEKSPDAVPWTPSTDDDGTDAGSPSKPEGARQAIAVFLVKARERAMIDRQTFRDLKALLDETYPSAPPERAAEPPTPARVETPRPAPSPERPATAEKSVRPPPDRIEPVPKAGTSGSAAAKPRERDVPKPPPLVSKETTDMLRRRAVELWELIGPDITVHGFAYLGVLLTFVGVFGFLFFAFVDVPDDRQPFIEILIPVIFFGWAYFLMRRGALLVAHLMGFLGGLLTPIVVYASLVDDAPVPPDLTGGWLIVGLVVTSLLIAAAYGWWSARHPDSWLRFLVAPMVWVAALGPGFAFKTDEPLVSEAITRLVSAQPALSAAAIAATLLFFTRRPDHRLAAPSFAAALPAVPIAYLLTVALAAGEGWAYPVPLVLAGAASLVSVEFLARRFGYETEIAVARPLLLAVALAPLIPLWGLGWAGLIAVVAYLGLVEWDIRSEADPAVLALAAAGVAGGLAMSVAEPWLMVAAWAAASVWAHVRRVIGLPADEDGSVMTTAAALLPLGVATGLVMGMPDGAALVVIGILLVAVTLAVRRSKTSDVFWTYWLTATGVALAVGTAAWYLEGGGASTPWAAVGTMMLAAVTMGAAPEWPAARVWMTSAAVAGALAIGFDAAAIANQAAWWGVIGLAAVAAATLWSHPAAAHLAAIGHLVGLGALLAGGFAGGRAIALAAWTLGWLAAVVADEYGRASARALVERNAPAASGFDDEFRSAVRAAPTVILAGSIPFAVLAAAGLLDWFAASRAWTGVTFTVLAVGYAVVSSWQAERAPLSTVFAVGAVVLSLAAIAASAPMPWPSILASVATIAVAWLVARPRQWTLFVWFAWAMSAVPAVLLAERAGLPDRHLHLALLGWGAALLIGGLVLDDARAGRRGRGEGLRIRWLQYPVVLGALAIPIGLAPVYAQEPATFGWWSLAAAVAYAAVAALLRVGMVTAPAYALAAFGVSALSPWSTLEQPFILVLVSAALVVASWASERSQRDSMERYLRWDPAPLVVAHGVAFVALVRAVEVESTGTWIAVGVLSVIVGLWKRDRVWADIGNVLVLIAAAASGPGWMALALAGTAARGVLSVPVTSGLERWSYHGLGVLAAGAAWMELGFWQGWSSPEAVSYTALAFGGLGLAVGGLIGLRDLESDWGIAWGGLALTGMAASAALAVPDDVVDVLPAVGFGLFALGAGTATRSIQHPALKWLTVVSVAGVWVMIGLWQEWSTAEAVSLTAIAFGGLGAVVGAWIAFRRLTRDWAAAWGGLASAGVAIAVAASLVPGNVADVLPAAGVALFGTGAALASRRVQHPALKWLAVAAAGLAWVEVGLWQQWSMEEAVSYSALAFGALATLVGGWSSFRTLERDWVVAWGGLALVGWAASVALAPGNIVDILPAVGSALFALGAGLTARRITHPAMQALTVGASGVAWVELVVGVGWTVEQAVPYTSLAAGAVALGAAVSIRFGRLAPSWGVAWGSLTVSAVVLAWLAALAQVPPAVGGLGPAIGLALMAVAAQLAARPMAYPLHYAAVGLTGWSWIALATGLDWSPESSAVITAVVFGGLAVGVSELARSKWGAPIRSDDQDGFAMEAARAWLGLGGAGVLAAGALALTVDERLPAWLAVSGGLALMALALARGAAPFSWPPMRELSALGLAAAIAALGYALDAPVVGMATTTILLGVAATAGALWQTQQRAGSQWRNPAALLGVAATALALVYATSALPDRGPIVLVLLGVAAQLVAAGIILERPVVLSLGPPVLLAAWLGIAAEAVGGSALWFTIPIALTLIAEVDVVRWSRRRAEQPAVTTELLALEYAAIGLLGVVVLVEMFGTSAAYALIGFLIAGGMLLWAAATRVRRRAVAAGVLATVTAVLAIFAAAAAQAPPSAFFWIAAAGAGFSVMLAMALVEAYRSKAGSVMLRIDELMEDWE